MTQANRPSPRQVLRGYFLLPHVVPNIVVMIATAAFAIVAAGGWPGLGPMARLLGAMFGGQLSIGAINELVDVELDRISKPEKPIPAGLVSPRGAWIVAAGGAIMMTVLSLTFGVESFLLCALGTGVGIAYSPWFKRTIWSWLPYLIALPLLPIWVWSALSSVTPVLFAVYPIGAAAVIAVQIAQSLPDVVVDQAAGVRTPAVALGPVHARMVCWGAMILAAALAVGLAPWLTDHHWRVWPAAVLAVGLVGVNAVIWRKNARWGAMACFPCTAIGTILLGVGWASALVGE